MKVPPLNITPEMNRVGMALPFSPELLRWSYPAMTFPQTPSNPPMSPMDIKGSLDFKSLPSHLSLDPRMWSRDDVLGFLRWVEREYDLPPIESTKFCMNGKALMMLNKNDMIDRSPEAGDIVHNTLQQISYHSHVPQSPITPHNPMSPLTTTAASMPLMQAADFHNLSHLLQQNSSVTLSPAHSEQSGGSPRHPDNGSTVSNGSTQGYSHSNGHSDSEDSNGDASSPQRSPVPATAQHTFSVQALASFKQITDYQRVAAAAAAAAVAHGKQDDAQHKQNLHKVLHLQQQQSQNLLHTQWDQLAAQHASKQSHRIPNLPSQQQYSRSSPPINPVSKPEQPTFTPSPSEDNVEPGTNGRLLWDFLQQLLNDKEQRYARFIAWRNADTGVFKIVDPAGLARLWGLQKNHLSMNYDKMSRALRYYYRVNILRKVQGERHCYQFLRNPTELRSIKNISSLKMVNGPARSSTNHQQIKKEQLTHQIKNVFQHQFQQPIALQQHRLSPTHLAFNHTTQEGPTDLSMTSNQQHHNDVDMHHNSDSNNAHQIQNLQDMSMHYNTEIKEEETISVDYIE